MKKKLAIVLSGIPLMMATCFVQCSQDIGLPPGKIVEQQTDPDPDPDPDPEPANYTPGEKVFGYNNYVEFIAGDVACPVIVTAGHGGYEVPESIPDRSCSGCVTDTDLNTQELARAIANAIEARTGLKPYLVINKLARRKLDPNREIGEAALGNHDAEEAYKDYHKFITDARGIVQENIGKGLLLDIHGHGHKIARIEVGYLLTNGDLEKNDAFLDGLTGNVSVRNIVEATGISVSQLLRGPDSFGSYLYANGYPAVPSTQDTSPGAGNPYFDGGYTTLVHGSKNGGTVSAIQLECYRIGIRDTPANRTAFATKLATIVDSYLQVHYDIDL